VAKGLARIVDRPAALLTSPLLRAKQTAAIAAAAWGRIEPEDTPALASGSFEALAAVLDRHPGDATVALVGHEPHVSALLGGFLGSRHDDRLAFKKGGAALVEVAGRLAGGGRLVWFLPRRCSGGCRGSPRAGLSAGVKTGYHPASKHAEALLEPLAAPSRRFTDASSPSTVIGAGTTVHGDVTGSDPVEIRARWKATADQRPVHRGRGSPRAGKHRGRRPRRGGRDRGREARRGQDRAPSVGPGAGGHHGPGGRDRRRRVLPGRRPDAGSRRVGWPLFFKDRRQGGEASSSRS